MSCNPSTTTIEKIGMNRYEVQHMIDSTLVELKSDVVNLYGITNVHTSQISGIKQLTKFDVVGIIDSLLTPIHITILDTQKVLMPDTLFGVIVPLEHNFYRLYMLNTIGQISEIALTAINGAFDHVVLPDDSIASKYDSHVSSAIFNPMQENNDGQVDPVVSIALDWHKGQGLVIDYQIEPHDYEIGFYCNYPIKFNYYQGEIDTLDLYSPVEVISDGVIISWQPSKLADYYQIHYSWHGTEEQFATMDTTNTIFLSVPDTSYWWVDACRTGFTSFGQDTVIYRSSDIVEYIKGE